MDKTLKQKNFEYQEHKDLFHYERAMAKSHIIYGRLLLDFFAWLEESGPGNTHSEWETLKHKRCHWEHLAWQEAVFKFLEHIKKEDFFIQVMGQTNNYLIKVGLWDKNDPDIKKTHKKVKKYLKKMLKKS